MYELLQPRLPTVKLPIGPNFLKSYQYEVRVIIQRDLFFDFPIEKAAQAPGRMCVSVPVEQQSAVNFSNILLRSKNKTAGCTEAPGHHVKINSEVTFQ